jgi:hypothetical protein
MTTPDIELCSCFDNHFIPTFYKKEMKTIHMGRTAFKLIHGVQQWYILSEPNQFQQEIPG